MTTTAITKTKYFGSTLPGTTAHIWNRVLPENLPSKTAGQAMSRPAWEKRVSKAILKYARIYSRVYEYDYGTETSGAEDYVPEGWDTSVTVARLGCELAIEEHIFESITSIAFEATTDTGWVKDYDSERWTRTLVYPTAKSPEWLKCEIERLYYRGPGFWSDDAQVKEEGDTVRVVLVSHNEGEV